ncbi:hypothetical protein HHX47_DHR5000214 [Lentinula edodes]|nr:hypothetical protein HHX47_DHR5000214 [Lentinula edodes]
MFPITSYFQRKTKKENVNPPKKRKQILSDDDEISLQPSGSSKKAKVDAPRRQQLSNRTKSLNKEGFSAAASSSTSASHTRTISRRTPPHHHYATPQSLARASDTGHTSDSIIDLTTRPSSSTQPQRDTNANPFLIQTPRPLPSMIVQPAPASSVHPPTKASSPRHFKAAGRCYSEMTSSSLPSIRQALSRSLATITPNTPKRSNHTTEIVPATPESPLLRLPMVPNESPDLSVPSSQNQEAEMDFLVNRKHKALTPDATNELDDLSQVPTSQSQEVEIDLYVHRKGVSLAADAITSDELFDLSQVPTSQSQEVEVDLSMYRKYNAKEHHSYPPSDEIVPCSQSQDFDGIFLEAVSPRRKRVLRELEQARQVATATDLSSGSGSRTSPTGCDERYNRLLEPFFLETNLVPSQSVFHSPVEVQSMTDEAVKSPMLSHENTIPYAAQEAISESPNIERPESNHAMVPINDEDIQSLFESEGLPITDNVINGRDGTKVELPSMPPSQAASVTESDSGDEQWMMQGLNTDARRPVLTSEVSRDPARPLTQREVQSWQTDVSAYSYPRDVLDFLDMLEGGPD